MEKFKVQRSDRAWSYILAMGILSDAISNLTPRRTICLFRYLGGNRLSLTRVSHSTKSVVLKLGCRLESPGRV